MDPARWGESLGSVQSRRDGVTNPLSLVLLQTPTTCANIGLFNLESLLPSEKKVEPFDLVISGPNFGRNTGTSFSLSSGTVGAALSASLSGVKAISLSYGHFQVLTEEMKAAEAKYKGSKAEGSPRDSRTPPPSADSELVDFAHKLSCRIISKLYSEWEDGVGVYSINVPLTFILKEEVIYWSSVWGNGYTQLFKTVEQQDKGNDEKRIYLPPSAPKPVQQLHFKPNVNSLLSPDSATEGSDTWAITKGYVSVSRLLGRFAEATPTKAPQGRFKL
jgi:tubulin--tyrosine ligase